MDFAASYESARDDCPDGTVVLAIRQMFEADQLTAALKNAGILAWDRVRRGRTRRP
ncbi:hypothetical protein [Actinoplanes sp. NPDC051411]|uniref:hypothetical protein n=1 Tax=Actinoplanes sp. NPDC051411 TaxID=3155522 RepID=UPI0034309825